MRTSAILLLMTSFAAFSGEAYAQEKKDETKKEAKEDADAAVQKKLDDQKVNLNFDGTGFSDAIDTLHELSGLNIVVSTAAGEVVTSDQPKVSLKVKELALRDALNLVLASPGFVYRVRNGVVFVMTKDEAKKQDAITLELEGAVKKKLESQKLTFNFNSTPLSEVLQFLSDFTGVTVEADKAIDTEQVKIDLRLKGVIAKDAILIIANQAGFVVKQKKDKLVFRPQEDEKDTKKDAKPKDEEKK